MAGAPVGNDNAAKGRIWNDALRKAIAQDGGHKVRQAVESLLTMAANGEAWAIKELADRLDGKPLNGKELAQADTKPSLHIYIDKECKDKLPLQSDD